LRQLLLEIAHGAPQAPAFVLNTGDAGLIRSLRRLSAQTASLGPAGRSSVAAHVRHLSYGFDLLNQWARGHDPFRDADYAHAWTQQDVTDEQWRQAVDSHELNIRHWIASLESRSDPWDATTLPGAIASVVHLAYHAGAIRQIAVEASGPAATD